MTGSNANDDEIKHQMETLLASDADLQQEAQNVHAGVSATNKDVSGADPSTFHNTHHPYQFIPLSMNGRTHAPSEGSRYLLDYEVTLEDLENMTHNFYDLAFQDPTLDKFIRNHSDPHGSRFAKWIHQKLSGSQIWDADRASRGRGCPVHDRTSAHVAAWYSPKRPAQERGTHFQLDECRVWMRIHFWALRETGLMEKSPSFADYYVRFIAHFVRVYENSAPAFARDSLRWSANPKNIEEYIRNGRKMKDVLKKSFGKAARQIPNSELDDDEWPYNKTPTY